MELRESYVQRYGNATSLALLDKNVAIYQDPTIDGIVGYRFVSPVAIVYGDPVCHPRDRRRLVEAFHEFCMKQGKRVIYVASSATFLSLLDTDRALSAIKIGDEIILDPTIDPSTTSGRHASVLRNKKNQALRDGLTLHEHCGTCVQTELKLEEVAVTWAQSRKGAQIYLYSMQLFAERNTKRWFYALYQGAIVGLIVLNKLDLFNGWVVAMVRISPNAPRYVSEVLILHVLDILRSEQCQYLTIGTVPAQDIECIGMSQFAQWLAQKLFVRAKRLFKLHDRQRYWRKFNPLKQPSYLILESSYFGIKDFVRLIRAFNL